MSETYSSNRADEKSVQNFDRKSPGKRMVKRYTRVYPKVSGLAARSENCKWYSSLPLGAVVSLFCESHSSEYCRHKPLCCFWTSNTKGRRLFLYLFSPETFGYTLAFLDGRVMFKYTLNKCGIMRGLELLWPRYNQISFLLWTRWWNVVLST
jgi:hypothetical protein